MRVPLIGGLQGGHMYGHLSEHGAGNEISSYGESGEDPMISAETLLNNVELADTQSFQHYLWMAF